MKEEAWEGHWSNLKASWFGKKPYEPWHLARCWIDMMKIFPRSEFDNMERHLIPELVLQVRNAAKTQDVSFLREFVEALESGCEKHYSKVREWLVQKHDPDESGKVPSFTHTELLEDAESKGIKIDGRTLRRLMKERHYRFKNARIGHRKKNLS